MNTAIMHLGVERFGLASELDDAPVATCGFAGREIGSRDRKPEG